ncbi:hypothetical protein ABTM96_20050, partial [Acinetobacter baumannii]
MPSTPCQHSAPPVAPSRKASREANFRVGVMQPGRGVRPRRPRPVVHPTLPAIGSGRGPCPT